MNKNAGSQPETSAQRALADYATAKFRDYQARWAPVQAKLATTIQNMHADNSFERGKLKASAAADAGIAFDKAERSIAANDANSGINLGSSAHKLRMAGMESDKATSIGLSSSAADQAIEDSYVSGLSALTQLGRGKEATIGRGMVDSARMSAGIAANDAYLSSVARAGDLNAAGTAAGIGLGFLGNRGSGGFRASSAMGAPNVGPQQDPFAGIPVN